MIGDEFTVLTDRHGYLPTGTGTLAGDLIKAEAIHRPMSWR